MKLLAFFDKEEGSSVVRGWINFYKKSWDTNAYINIGCTICFPITVRTLRFDVDREWADHRLAWSLYFRIRKPGEWKRIIFNTRWWVTYISEKEKRS